MTIKLNVILATIFFLALPFIYFYADALHYLPFLNYTFVGYFVIAPSSLLFAYYIEKNIGPTLKIESKQMLFLTAVILVSVYAFYLFLVTWYMFDNFFSQGADLVYFQQYIWQLSEFKLPYIWGLTVPDYPVWSQHFSPFIALLVPFFWISHSAGLLLMEQALVVLSGTIPIYFIAKRHLHSRGVGLALSFAYLSFGGIQFGMEYGFHEIMFFPTVFLWAYYFYVTKRKYLYFFFIFLSLLIKEEVAFIVLFWGIYLILLRKDRIGGTVTAAMGLVWSYVCFSLIFPYFNQGKSFGYWGQYDQAGGSGLSGIIKGIMFNPLKFLETLVTPPLKIDMMLQTFGQFSFLLLFFPPALLIIVPSLMEKLMSSSVAMGNGAHYSAAICAVTIIATFEALPHIGKYKIVNKYIHYKNLFFTILIFYVGFFSNVLYGFIDYSLAPNHGIYMLETNITDDNRQLLKQIINNIPHNATVSSNAPIPPHLNKYYKDTIMWPDTVGQEDFVLIDTQFSPAYGTSGKVYNDALDKLNKNQNYQLAFSQNGILVYRRKSFKFNSNGQ